MTTGKIKIDPYATSHPINEGTSYIPVNFQKSKGQPGGHLKPHDTRSTRLQELSLMNSTYFGDIHYDIHLNMKLDYTISRTFQEMSLSELETLRQLCELERTQILQSLALAVLKIPYAGYLLSGNRSNFLDNEGNILWFYTCTKKVSPLYVFEDKRCYKRIPIFYKNKVHFVDTLSRRTYFWDTAVPCGSENSHNVVQLNPGFFGIFSSSINKILLDAQIKEYNRKIATRQNTYDEEHNNVEITPTAPQLPPLPQNHPLSLVPRNFRNLTITHNPNFRPTISQSPIQDIMTHHSLDENTYEQIIEQPHTTAFQSQNNNFLAHDEPTTWIPTPLKFPPNQPQHSNYNNSTFCFPATRFPNQ